MSLCLKLWPLAILKTWGTVFLSYTDLPDGKEHVCMSFRLRKTQNLKKNQTLIHGRNSVFDKQLSFMTNNCNRSAPPNIRAMLAFFGTYCLGPR